MQSYLVGKKNFCSASYSPCEEYAKTIIHMWGAEQFQRVFEFVVKSQF